MESIPFSTLIEGLVKIESCKGENSKDKIKQIFSDIFENIIISSPDDLPRAYYFLLSKVGPEYKANEFGIGTHILEKVVGKAIGKNMEQIKESMIKLGDLALVAMEGKKSIGTMDKFSGFTNNTVKKELTLKIILENFIELANLKGKSSMEVKEKLLLKLLFSASKEEIKYIIRSLQKGLKIGASFKTIIAALARAVCSIYNGGKVEKEEKKSNKNKTLINNNNLTVVLDEKEAEKTILISINNLSDEDIVFHHLIDVIKNRETFQTLIDLCKITPGIPVKPQLAKPTNGINVIFQRFEGVPFTCEFKYDGFRGHVHHFISENGYKTDIFSRNLERMTEAYPDVVEYIDTIRTDKVTSFILDCEIVAFDTKTNKILPFHQLTTRARKNVIKSDITINVCMFVFDIVYLNGTNVCNLTLEERRNLIKDNFVESEHIQFAKYINSEKFEDVEVFMSEALVGGKFNKKYMFL